MSNDLSWMGQKSTYSGPSLREIKALEQKKQNAKRTLFINKLPESVTKIELRSLFVSIGCTVLDCRIVYKQHKSTGVAYVDLAEEADVVKALGLHQTECQGSKISVRRHVSREKLHEIVRKGNYDDSGKKNSYNNRKAKEKSKNVCFDYQKGDCKRGDSCRFQHDNSAKNNKRRVKNEKKAARGVKRKVDTEKNGKGLNLSEKKKRHKKKKKKKKKND